MKTYNCLPGSAWHDWQAAGHKWRQETYANTPGALLLASVTFASFSDSENERNAKKRAFVEGANFT